MFTLSFPLWMLQEMIEMTPSSHFLYTKHLRVGGRAKPSGRMIRVGKFNILRCLKCHYMV